MLVYQDTYTHSSNERLVNLCFKDPPQKNSVQRLSLFIHYFAYLYGLLSWQEKYSKYNYFFSFSNMPIKMEIYT